MAEMMVNKEEALMAWLSKCPLFAEMSAPLLGYLRESDGSCAIRPVAGAEELRDFIDGTKLISYDFYLELMLSLSSTADKVNEANMFTARRWQEWLEEMEENGDYPDFGEDCVCFELRKLSNMPQMAQVYEGGMAKYRFPARLIYWEK